MVDGQGEMCDTVDQISHSTFTVHISPPEYVSLLAPSPYVHHINTNFLHKCSFWLRTQSILNFEYAGENTAWRTSFLLAVMVSSAIEEPPHAEMPKRGLLTLYLHGGISKWRYYVAA